jgi:predicted ester cyclase
MSVEDNKSTVLRFVEAVNVGNRDAAEQVVDAANYKENNPAWGAISFDAAWQTYDMVRAALPDLRFIPDEDLIVAEGDKVVVRGTVTGTHTGAPLFGVPATGKQLTWTGIDTSRVENGKIVERWLNADILGLMQQLGLGSQG